MESRWFETGMNEYSRSADSGGHVSVISRRKLLSTSIIGAGTVTLLSSPLKVMGFDSNEIKFPEFTDESKSSIEKGSKWLLRALNDDGGAGPDIGTLSDPACSAVVGLAFLSQGHTPSEGKYNRHQKRLSEYLLLQTERSSSSGRLANGYTQVDSDLGSYASHFLTALYLSQAMGEARNVDRYFLAVQKLEQIISGAQLGDGSWGDDAWAPILGTACGWLSLRSVNFAGVKVSGSAQRAGQYILKNIPTLGASWGSRSWYHRFYGSAAALRVLYSMQKENRCESKKSIGRYIKAVGEIQPGFWWCRR